MFVCFVRLWETRWLDTLMFRQYVYVVAFLSGLDGVSSHHSSHDAKKSWRINHQSACGMFKRFQKKVTKICMVSDVCCVPAAKQWMIFEVEKKILSNSPEHECFSMSTLQVSR